MLEIPLEKVCYLVAKAHQFDAKVEPVEPDPGSNPSDDHMLEVLADYPDDPVDEEIKAFIDGLNVDERTDLVALMWLGREGLSADDWQEVRTQAYQARNDHTAEYVMGTPLLADYLQEGLAALGLSCEDE